MKTRYIVLIVLGLVAVQIVTVYALGNSWICPCGYVKLWQPITHGFENSQHLTDLYSFSHIAHGFIFYFIAWLIAKKRGWPLWIMFLLALGIEVGWEVFENTSFIIDRYRSSAISFDYYGDSVLNSLTDTFFMMTGFYLAYRLPALSVVMLIVVMELFALWYIRDNLTLNLIMLIHPFKTILLWQAGGG